MTDIKDILDFESIVEAAVAKAIRAQEMTAYTSAGPIPGLDDDAPELDFQKIRPRWEVYFILGEGQKRWVPRALLPADMQAEWVESAWKAQIHISGVFNADAESKRTRADYAAKMRRIIPKLPTLVNGTYLTKHCIKMPRTVGDSRESTAEIERLTMMVEVDFSIQAGAWALLSE